MMFMAHKPFGKMTETGRAEITPYERQLIDDAIRAGMVRQIPIHASAKPEYRWDGRLNQIVAINGPTAQDVRNLAFKRYQEHRAKKARERRADITRLIDDGKSLAEIASIRGESYDAIKKISAELFNAKPPEERGRSRVIEVAEKRQNEIEAAMRDGKNATEIATERGESRKTILAIMKRIRSLRDDLSGPDPYHAELDRKRGEVKKLLSDGVSKSEIAKSTKYSRSFVFKIATELRGGSGS